MTQTNSSPIGGGGRIYAASREAQLDRARRTLGVLDNVPPPWADGPENDDGRPPPDPAPQPEPEDEAEPEPEPEPRPLTTIRPHRPELYETEPDPEPQPDTVNWLEWSAAIALIAGMTVTSTGIGLWLNPYLGVTVAGVFLLIVGVALGVASTRNGN